MKHYPFKSWVCFLFSFSTWLHSAGNANCNKSHFTSVLFHWRVMFDVVEIFLKIKEQVILVRVAEVPNGLVIKTRVSET